MSKIKDIIKILCGICFIVMCLHSCVKAYTWEEYKTFLDSLQPDTTIGGNYNVNLTQYNNYRIQVIEAIETFCSPEDYNSFVICFTNTGPGISFNFTGFITNSNNTYTTNSESAIIFSNCVADSYRFNCFDYEGFDAFTVYGFKNYTGPRVDCNYLSPRKVGTDTIVWSDGIRGPSGLWLLNNANDTFLTSNSYPTQAYWNYIFTNNFTINNLVENFHIANGYKGLNYANSTINYFLYNNQNQSIQELSYNYYNGRSFNLYCDLTDSNIINGSYYIKMVDISSNPNKDIYKSSNFNLTFFNGDNNNNSNIVIGGLSPITNGSGDLIGNIDNSNIVNNLYNTLFVMQSGDSNELYNLVSSYFPSGETPISIYDTIFGSLSNEPDDFIIRWDDFPLNFTFFGGQTGYSGDFIKAGSINFSKTCRDNSVLSLIKFWLNTFIVIGFLFTFYSTLYNCICHILGVVSEDIDVVVGESEHREIGFKM